SAPPPDPPDPPDPLSPSSPSFDFQFPTLQTTVASPPLSKKQISLLKGTASFGSGNGKSSLLLCSSSGPAPEKVKESLFHTRSADFKSTLDVTVHNSFTETNMPAQQKPDTQMTDAPYPETETDDFEADLQEIMSTPHSSASESRLIEIRPISSGANPFSSLAIIPSSQAPFSPPRDLLPPITFSSSSKDSHFVVALAANPIQTRRSSPFKHKVTKKRPSPPSHLSITLKNAFSTLDSSLLDPPPPILSPAPDGISQLLALTLNWLSIPFSLLLLSLSRMTCMSGDNQETTLHYLERRSCSKPERCLSLLAWQASIYFIWTERNNRLHRQHYRSSSSISTAASSLIKNKISSFRDQNSAFASTLFQIWIGG
ncbi:hypothetical protein HID58_022204, partial [Brassica napus]